MDLNTFISDIRRHVLLNGFVIDLLEGECLFTENEVCKSVYVIHNGDFVGIGTNGLKFKLSNNDIIGLKELLLEREFSYTGMCISESANINLIEKERIFQMLIKNKAMTIKWLFSTGTNNSHIAYE